jgi:hypothetical protein
MANDGQNAAALEHAVLDGKDIHVVLDLSRCVEHRSGNSGPEVRGSLHPDEFMVQKDHTMSLPLPASEGFLTLLTSSRPRHRP